MQVCGLCGRFREPKELENIKVTTQNMSEGTKQEHGDFFNIYCCDVCWAGLITGKNIIIICAECKQPETWDKEQWQLKAKNVFDEQTIKHMIGFRLVAVEMPLCNT